MEDQQNLIEMIEEIHSKYNHDRDLEKMPSMSMLVGNLAKKKLEDEYGVTYMKRRLEIEDQLKLNENIQKKKDEDK